MCNPDRVPVLEIHLRDLNASLVAAWEEAFADVPGVSISQGDIFSTQPRLLPNNAPIDVDADAVVSPANSFHFMDGGIDAVYTHQFGFALEQRLQALVEGEYGGELPVGCAVIAETGSPPRRKLLEPWDRERTRFTVGDLVVLGDLGVGASFRTHD